MIGAQLGVLLPLFDREYTPRTRSLYKGRILLSDILGRRQPAGFVSESCPIRGGTL
jgi:hypothetical protein